MLRFALLLLLPAAAFAEAPPTAIDSPKAEAVVGVKETVTGECYDRWPVVAVRTPTGEIYVQQPIAREKGNSFSGEAYFGGKDNTGRGTRYELLVFDAPNQKEAETLKPGLQKSLPKWPISAKRFVYRDERLEFGGETWAVKKFDSMGPGPNRWTDDKASVLLDEKKHFHLAIAKGKSGWECSEIVCNRALGFGTYTWVFRTDLAAFDPRAVLGLFTYQNSLNKNGIPDKEIDFELSRWSDPKNDLGQFVVQPYLGDKKKNIERFAIPETTKMPLTVRHEWSKGKVESVCLDGDGKALRKWSYRTTDEPGAAVPPADGKERAIANLWLNEGKAPSNEKPVKVVIESFQFEKPKGGK